jgi:hypothetical protein
MVRLKLKTIGDILIHASVFVTGTLFFSGCGSTKFTLPAPVITPVSGAYQAEQPITISDSATGFGVTIYYTTDGSTPTTASPIYAGPIVAHLLLDQSETVNAIAVSPQWGSSPVASVTYTLNLPAVPAPIISPAAGTYSATQTVSITDSLAGATIFYTTDGSTPTTASSIYTGSFPISKTRTVQAIAVAPANNVSALAFSPYTINVATPVISPAGGTFTAAQTVTISDATAGAAIYYTTDGSAPTASSTLYSAPITVSQSETVQAIGVEAGNGNSAPVAALFSIMYPAATPVISPSGGTFSTVQTATITDASTGAAIYYTTDGTTPTVSSAVYSAPIKVSQSETVQAIAAGGGFSASPVASALFTLNFPTAPSPVFTPATGTYTSSQSVTISDSLAGSTIYYTTDGSAPSTSSKVYTGPISVTSSTSIRAIAAAPNFNQSSAVTSTYYILIGGTPLNGTVKSGTVPIYNAAVSIYAAGTSGYGTGSTLLATTTTDATGAFQFTKLANFSNGVEVGSNFACPASDPNPDPQIYIAAIGGNTQNTNTTSTNNNAAGFIAAVGPCSQIAGTTQVQMNELTTVATVFALAQYINPGSTPGTEVIGTDSANVASNPAQGAIGLNNAVNGIANLANLNTGVAVTSNTYTGTNAGVTGVTVTATPETAKLTTIADVLAACINSASSTSAQCVDLLANATAPPNASLTSQPSATFATAQDTIQAAYYMAVNPINAGTFTACSTSTETTTLGCLYNLASSNPPYASGLKAAPTDWTLGIAFASPTVLGATGAQSYFLYTPLELNADSNGNIYSLNGPNSATSSPYNSVSSISPLGVPVGHFYGGAALGQPRNMALDTNNNIWITNQSTAVLSSALVELTQAGTVNTFSYTSNLYGIAIDQYNDVFVGAINGSGVAELKGGTGSLSALPGSTSAPEGIALDANNNLWVTSNFVTTASKYPATCTTICTYANPTFYSGLQVQFGIAIDRNSIPWITETASSMLVKLNPAVSANGGTSTTAKQFGISNPEFIAIDGASNIWIADSSPSSVTELASGSITTALSPSAGFAHTFNGPRGIVIDMSGNVWVGNSNATNAAGSYTITEIVGAAVPAVQPLSQAVSLKKIGTMP